MKIIVRPRRSVRSSEEVEDLRLDRDVERADRLVGDQQLGLRREAARDRDALALAAAELAREAARDLAARGRRARAARRPCPRASSRSASPCTRSGSAIAAPTVMRGFSELNGSWKTICIRRRMRLQAPCRRSAAQVGAVEDDRALRPARSSRVMQRASVVLPLPDSPTIPSVRWRSSESETSSTAVSVGARRAVEPARAPCAAARSA